MRLAFIKALLSYAKENDKTHLLTGDLGFQVFEEYRERYPNQFTNAGVAEANMVGVAAGMAHLGFKCICYSIAPFLVFRALEQIRNDVCYHNLDVKIVGVGGGLSYSLNGQSHHTIEDIAITRSLPNMTVLCPGDPLEAYRATIEMLKMTGPVYLRLGKAGEPIITYDTIGNFAIGKPVELKKGEGLVIISTGNMLSAATEIIEGLTKANINAAHVHIHTIKPIDREAISKIIRKHHKIVTIEEHSVIGGLGSAIAEINVSDSGLLKKQLIIGINDRYLQIGGSQQYVRKELGIDVETIVKRILNWYEQ